MWGKDVTIALLAALIVGCAASAASASAATSTGQVVFTIRPSSGPGVLWLDKPFSGTTGPPLVTTARPNVETQLWQLVSLPGHTLTDPQFRIVNVGLTNRCLIRTGLTFKGKPHDDHVTLQVCGRFPKYEAWRLYRPGPNNGLGPLRVPVSNGTAPWWIESADTNGCLMAPFADDPTDREVGYLRDCQFKPSLAGWRLTRGVR
jgi:hypothetical protein